MNLLILPELYAVAKYPTSTPIPDWVWKTDGFLSVTKTDEELSIVSLAENFGAHLPDGVQVETEWRALKVEGPLDFSLTGILASLAQPLALHQISIFAISTYNTDYLLVKANKLSEAIDVLTAKGHRITLP